MASWTKYEEFMQQADSSILDEIRLLSLDQLFRRTVEFHHNHHSYPIKEPFDATIASYENSEVLVEVQLFEDSRYD